MAAEYPAHTQAPMAPRKEAPRHRHPALRQMTAGPLAAAAVPTTAVAVAAQDGDGGAGLVSVGAVRRRHHRQRR